MKKMKPIFYSFMGLALLGMLPVAANAASGAGFFSYEGRIYDLSGEPSVKKVNLILRVMSPDEQCILREERTDLIDLAASSGYFSVSVGNGTRYGVDPDLSLSQVFTNGQAVTGKTEQGSSCNVTGATGAGRYLRVLIDDSGIVTAMTPDVPIGTSPYAVVANTADSVGGFNADQLLRVEEGGIPQNTSPLSNAHYQELMALVAGTSDKYLKSEAGPSGVTIPSYQTALPPASPVAGSIWYDSDLKLIKYFDGTNPVTLGAGSGSGTVISVAAGEGLSGGPITTSGTISLSDVGTPGNYYKVMTDAKGRVISGSTFIAETDLPTISTTGKVSGSAIAGTISGSTSINTSGTITSSSMAARQVDFYDATSTNHVQLRAPASFASSYTLTFPPTAGSSGNFLSVDSSGNLLWASPENFVRRDGSLDMTGPMILKTSSMPSAPALSFANAATNTGLYYSSSPQGIGFSIDGQSKMVVNSAGVGIGTSAPSVALAVAGEVKFGNQSSSCNPSLAGAQRYDSVNNRMEFCNGTEWLPYAYGPQGVMSCPVNWIMVGNPGDRSTFCIQKYETLDKTYFEAKDACFNTNIAPYGSAHICTYREWYAACTTKSSDLPNIKTLDNWQWVEDMLDSTRALTVGGEGFCGGLFYADHYYTPARHAYRCCLN